MNYREKAFSLLPPYCKVCSDCRFLTVHHKDLNPYNNDINNLEILCFKCHQKVHGTKMPKKKIRTKYQKGTSKKKRK